MATGLKNILIEYCPKRRNEWRLWLKENHTLTEGIWLILAKKESGLPTVAINDAIEEALCYGWIDSVPNKLDKNYFKILFSPRNPKSKWSRINKERVNKLAKLGMLAPSGKKMIAIAKKQELGMR